MIAVWAVPLLVIIFHFIYPYSLTNLAARLAVAVGLSLFVYLLGKDKLRLKVRISEKGAVLVVLAAALLASFLLVVQNIHFSGDEPHYLLITKSIVYDFDLDVKNQYQQEQWQEFYDRKVRILPHANPGLDGGWYPMHLPGISVLLVPFYLLSKPLPVPAKNFILRAGFSLYGLLFLVMLLKILQREFPGLERELLLLSCLTIPIFPYFFHLFPEIPAAGIFLFIFYHVFYRNPSFPNLFLLGLFSGTLAWFGVKFPVLVFALLLILLWRRGFKAALVFLGGFLAVYSTFLYYLKVHYGAFSPAVVYNGMMTPQQRLEFLKLVLYKIPLHYRTETFLDYFLGQRDGLLPYAPYYLFAIAGLWLARRRKVLQAGFLVFFLFYFSYAWLTHRGGYCPPVRPLVPVMWVLVLGLGAFLSHNRNRTLRAIFYSASLIAFLFVILLMAHPLALYQATTHDVVERAALLFHKISNFYIYLPWLLPSYIKAKPPSEWLPNYIWSFLLLLALFLIVRFSRREGKSAGVRIAGWVLVAAALPFLLFPNIPLREGKMVTADRGRMMVFNAKRWKKKCVLAFESHAPVFILQRGQKLHVRAEEAGQLLITGRRGIEMEKGQLKVFEADQLPSIPFKGKRLVEVKVKNAGPFLICPSEKALKEALQR